ncbi:molybdopterin-dependent oxidoreductase [uncultured Roseobacter sp.]|uniref:molybdopterin-dependent oxidoreductase n=1 Tax=uncultured Roseobacter sp. TaxID=114847 RepID=UPI00345D7F60
MRILPGILAGLVLALAAPASAEQLADPQSDVVLTVSGDIGLLNDDGTARFDLQMLAEMPAVSYTTSTIWTEGEKTFVGVPLADLLDVVDASDGTVLATAINDYTVEIPVASVTATAPIVAYQMDGREMSRRQKGPLWIVYPYDSDPEFRTEVIYSRSIWQLDRLEVVQ